MLAAGGVELALGARGEAAGPPVLLVHGFGGSARAWGEPALAGLERGRRLLLVDLLGHGASDDPEDPARVSLDPVLDDLERALDAAGVESCDWIGYSMGGRIALAAALLRPARIRRLVLESASPGLEDEGARAARRAQDDELAARIQSEGIDAWIREWERSPPFAGRAALPDAVRLPFLAARRANRADALAAWLRGLGTGAQPSFWDRLGEVRAPTLLVTGAGDPRYTEIARRMESVLPEARRATVAGAGHTVHLEAPEGWIAALDAFLTDEAP